MDDGRITDLGEQGPAVAGKMVAEQDLPWRALQELGESGLAIEERAWAQVAAVAVEEVESVKDQGTAATLEGLVEQVQVRNSVWHRMFLRP